MFVEFFYVVNVFNLRLTVPLVEMPLKYTIREFTILKKLILPRGGGKFISTLWMFLICQDGITITLKKAITVILNTATPIVPQIQSIQG